MRDRRHRDERPQPQPPTINPLEFSAWLTATHSVDAHTLTAGQRAEFENKFEEAAAGWIIATVSGTPAMEAGAFDTVADPADPVTAQAIADNSTRLAEIFEMTMSHPAIGAAAIRQGWSLVETDRAICEATAGQYNGGW